MVKRPLLAVFHEASTATDLLRRAGGEPAVRLVSFSDEAPALAHVDAIAAHLSSLTVGTSYRDDAVDPHVMDAVSASTLAGRPRRPLRSMRAARGMKAVVRQLLARAGVRVSRSGAANRFDAMSDALRGLSRLGFTPDVIVDAGANVGQWARIAGLCFPMRFCT